MVRPSLLLSVALFLMTAVACGSDDDDGGGGASSPALSSCHAMCAAQYKDCPNSLPDCRQLCDYFVPGFGGDCVDKAKAFYDCGAGIEWTCSGIVSQQKDTSQCKAEQTAYAPCLQSK